MLSSFKDTTTAYDSAGRTSSIDESVSGYKQAFSYPIFGLSNEKALANIVCFRPERLDAYCGKRGLTCWNIPRGSVD